jgi:hypothetical protein
VRDFRKKVSEKTMKTIQSTVGFQDESGTLLANGSLILTLPAGVYEIAAGGGQVAGRSLTINLDANAKIPAATQIWASDELLPQVPYTVTVCAQANGLQAVGSANWLIVGASPIDLSQMVNTAPGVTFPVLGPQFIIVPFSATAAFVGPVGLSTVVTFQMTLTGNVTAPTLSGLLAGQIVIFKLIEDGAGGRTFTWPSNVLSPQSLDTAPNAVNLQAFVYDGTNCNPITPGIG